MAATGGQLPASSLLEPGSGMAPGGEAQRNQSQLMVQGRGCPTALGASQGGAGGRSGKDDLHFLHLSAPKPRCA